MTIDADDEDVLSISKNHIYIIPGIYTLTLAITDSRGATDTMFPDYIVVYDPQFRICNGRWLDRISRRCIPG